VQTSNFRLRYKNNHISVQFIVCCSTHSERSIESLLDVDPVGLVLAVAGAVCQRARLLGPVKTDDLVDSAGLASAKLHLLARLLNLSFCYSSPSQVFQTFLCEGD
jgi:hypothetical protein